MSNWLYRGDIAAIAGCFFLAGEKNKCEGQADAGGQEWF